MSKQLSVTNEFTDKIESADELTEKNLQCLDKQASTIKSVNQVDLDASDSITSQVTKIISTTFDEENKEYINDDMQNALMDDFQNDSEPATPAPTPVATPVVEKECLIENLKIELNKRLSR